MNEWMNEWVNEWMRSITSWQWMNEWMNEWMSAWMNAINHVMAMNEWMNEWVNEWMNDWMNEWMNDWMNGSMPIADLHWPTKTGCGISSAILDITWQSPFSPDRAWFNQRSLIAFLIIKMVTSKNISAMYLNILKNSHAFFTEGKIVLNCRYQWWAQSSMSSPQI